MVVDLASIVVIVVVGRLIVVPVLGETLLGLFSKGLVGEHGSPPGILPDRSKLRNFHVMIAVGFEHVLDNPWTLLVH